MKLIYALLLGLILSAGCPALAQEAPTPSSTETPPTPSDAPSFDIEPICRELRPWNTNYYPQRAFALGVTGDVTLDCALSGENKYTTCQIVSEAPLRYGFAAAAVRLACLTNKATPGTADAAALARAGTIYLDASGHRRARITTRFHFD